MDDELINNIAHRLDPLVFEHQGPLPPRGFLGSPGYWEVAKNSRRQRATREAAAALRAIQSLDLIVVPRGATAAAVNAGAAALVSHDASAEGPQRAVRDVWEAMLAAVADEPA